MKPDVYVKVRFRSESEGGRKSPIFGAGQYGCVFLVDDRAFDCRILLDNARILLGQTYELPFKFLNAADVIPLLSIGKKVRLWEGKEIADGKVTRILWQQQKGN